MIKIWTISGVQKIRGLLEAFCLCPVMYTLHSSPGGVSRDYPPPLPEGVGEKSWLCITSPSPWGCWWEGWAVYHPPPRGVLVRRADCVVCITLPPPWRYWWEAGVYPAGFIISIYFANYKQPLASTRESTHCVMASDLIETENRYFSSGVGML